MGKRAAVRSLAGNEASAKIMQLRTSPQKLGVVAETIRGLKVEQALVQLQFSKKRIAQQVKVALTSAIANAENNHNLDIDSLIVSEVRVGKSSVMKGWHAGARGRGARILKPFSNFEIIVRESE